MVTMQEKVAATGRVFSEFMRRHQFEDGEAWQRIDMALNAFLMEQSGRIDIEFQHKPSGARLGAVIEEYGEGAVMDALERFHRGELRMPVIEKDSVPGTGEPDLFSPLQGESVTRDVSTQTAQPPKQDTAQVSGQPHTVPMDHESTMLGWAVAVDHGRVNHFSTSAAAIEAFSSFGLEHTPRLVRAGHVVIDINPENGQLIFADPEIESIFHEVMGQARKDDLGKAQGGAELRMEESSAQQPAIKAVSGQAHAIEPERPIEAQKTRLDELTPAQRDALVQYRDAHGKSWKSRLLKEWHEDNVGPELRQIRNLKGPRWLGRLSKADFVNATRNEGLDAIRFVPMEGLEAGQDGATTEGQEDALREGLQSQQTGIGDANTAKLSKGKRGVEEDTISEGPVKNAEKEKQDEQAKPGKKGLGPKTLQNGKFERDEAGQYRRAGEEAIALVDEGQRIRFIDKQQDTYLASIELAAAKGWKTLEVTGSPKFRAEAWKTAKLAGFEVFGYTPTEQDLANLEAARFVVGHGKVPTPEESGKSKAAAEAMAKVKYGNVVAANTQKGLYCGPLVQMTEHHAVQDIGRRTAVIHELRQLPRSEVESALTGRRNLSIEYEAGVVRAKAKEPCVQSKGR